MKNHSIRCGIVLSLLFGILMSTEFAPQAVSREPSSSDSEGFVVIGRLEKSLAGTTQAPRYALFDHRGKIRYLVTPDDGLNIHPYIGQQVVLTGRAGPRKQNHVPRFLVEQIKTSDPVADPAVNSAVMSNENEASTSRVTPAAFQSEITPSDEVFNDLDIVPNEEIPLPMSENIGNCSTCGSSTCGGSGCYIGYPNKYWVQADYLLWWTKGMRVPPLVSTSTSGVTRAEAGVLGLDSTSILLGEEPLLKSSRSGFRLRAGTWFDPCHLFGFESEFFSLGTAAQRYVGTSDGESILARPFYNSLTDQEDAELVAFPDVIEGTVGMKATGDLQSVALDLRFNRCCQPVCWPLPGCQGATASGFQKLDVILGYRYLSLEEGLMLTEDLSSLEGDIPSQFNILDQFDTENQFHGGEIGLIYEIRGMRWSMEMRGKIALGNVSQRVTIDGNTDITTAGTTLSYPSGILTQRTNIGSYTRDQFAVIPELGVSLGYQLTPRLRAIFGYTFLYCSNVVRPGEHIDTVVNPNLFPPELDPFVGELRPRFAFEDTDFWAQGLNFGLHGEW